MLVWRIRESECLGSQCAIQVAQGGCGDDKYTLHSGLKNSAQWSDSDYDKLTAATRSNKVNRHAVIPYVKPTDWTIFVLAYNITLSQHFIEEKWFPVLTYCMDIFERLDGPILPLPGRNTKFWILSNEMKKKARSFVVAQTTEQKEWSVYKRIG